MGDVFTHRALRADPHGLFLLANNLDSRDAGGHAALAVIEGLVDSYESANEGPHISTIVCSATALVDGFRSAISGLPEVVDALRVAYRRLSALEDDSDAVWRDAQLIESVVPIPPVDGALLALVARFNVVRRGEDNVFDRLADAVGAARSGFDVELGFGLTELFGGLIRNAADFGDHRLRFDLQIALAATTDYQADSDFDTFVSDRQRKQFADIVELGQAGYDDAALLALEGEPTFVVAVIDELRQGDRTLDEVLAAIEQSMHGGAPPGGLSDDLFPPAYLELKRLEGELDGQLRADLDAASGWVWLPDWIDSEDDSAARRIAEEAIDENITRQSALRHALGIDGEPGIEQPGAMSLGATSDQLVRHGGAAPLWAGRFAHDLQRRGGDSWGRDNRAGDVGLDRMAIHIGGDPEVALAFFNELGAEDAARLVQTYEPGMRGLFVQLGDGLGLAIGTGELNFDGAAYARGFGPAQVSPLQLLVISDRIPDRFMVDATAESFRLSHHNLGNSSINTMGAGGPYDDVPEGASFYPDPEMGGELLIGKLRGQFDSGRYGRPTDDPSLVMLNVLAERDPNAMLALLEDLGATDADALLRRGGHGLPPRGWDDGDGNRLTEILFRLTDPDATGDPELSDRAALLLLTGAGNPPTTSTLTQFAAGSPLALPPDVGDAIEQILVDRPTVMVQGPGLARQYDLELAGIVPDPVGDLLDGQTIDNAIEAVFLGGEGDQLLEFKDSLIPVAVARALVVGGGDPHVIGDMHWLGSIDGRIDGGISRAAITEAQILDARNGRIRGPAGTVTESLAALMGPGGSVIGGATTDIVVGQILDRTSSSILPTDTELQAWKARWQGENDESLLLAFQLLDALDVAGRVVIPEGMSPREFMDRGEYRLSHVVVLDGDGDGDGVPLVVDGEQVSANDWSRQFSDFLKGNARAEGGGG